MRDANLKELRPARGHSPLVYAVPMSDHRQPTSRDLYGRRPTSTSRGKTHERIMALQREDGVLPGAEHLLVSPQDGSIASCVQEFLMSEIVPLTVTARRAYERTLVLFLRDLHDNGPDLQQPCNVLTHDRIVQHLEWRRTAGLVDPTELTRCCVHFARFASWSDSHCDAQIRLDQEQLRTIASL